MARNPYLQIDPDSRAWACEDEAFHSVLSSAVLYMLQAHLIRVRDAHGHFDGDDFSTCFVPVRTKAMCTSIGSSAVA